jgi:hypothetical protein
LCLRETLRLARKFGGADQRRDSKNCFHVPGVRQRLEIYKFTR